MLSDLTTILSLVMLVASIGLYLKLRKADEVVEHKKQELLDLTRQEAQIILDEAQTKALDIISAGKAEAVNDKHQISEKLQEISADQLREFKEVLQTVSKSLQKDTQEELGKFREALEVETVQSQKFVADKIQKDYETVLAAINAYRQQKETEIEAKSLEVIKKIVKQVGGKAIAEESQKQLIMHALNQAHEEGII